jgi:hypothetical protein
MPKSDDAYTSACSGDALTAEPLFAADRLEQIIDAYVADYELIGEDESGRDGCYAPTNTERGLIKDAIMGLLGDPDWDAEWGKHIAQLAVNRDTAAYTASLAAENERLRSELEQLRALICYVGIVGRIDGYDVIRRESVLDMIDRSRRALAKEQP